MTDSIMPADSRGRPATARTKLSRLIEPRSIAVVGASSDPSKRGNQIIRALRNSGYAHPIFPINPKGGTILDLMVLHSISEMPSGVDVAVIARPAQEVASILYGLEERDVAGAVVLASGFKERGEAGRRFEAELQAAIQASGVRVVGPNTSGTINFSVGANLVGFPDVPDSGPISVVTQSGNMLLSIVSDHEANNGPGFDTYIGLGNQIDVGYEECITELASRTSTSAIALHSEGFHDGRSMLDSASQAARECPVVLLRGGRSQTGRQAAMSHTGSVAAPDRVAVRVLKQAGVTLVDRSDELVVVAGALATTPLPIPNRGVAVISDGGGHAALAADALSNAGVDLATLSHDSRQKLEALLGLEAVVANPIDIASAGDADSSLFVDCAEVLAADPNVGIVLFVGLYGGYHLRFDTAFEPSEDIAAERLVDLISQRGLPVIVQSSYAHSRPENHKVLRQAGVQVLPSIDHAVRCVQAVVERSRWVSTSDSRMPHPGEPKGSLIEVAHPDRLLPEPTARRLIEGVGIDTGSWEVVGSPVEAEEAVGRLGPVCALKVVSAEIVHKSDVGGVKLSVSQERASHAYSKLLEETRLAAPDAHIDGVLVTPMAEPGLELFIGAKLDEFYGPVVAFGAGGLLVEVLEDVSFRAAPLSVLEAQEMVRETTVSRLLSGFRGMPEVDTEKLSNLLVMAGESISRVEGLVQLDLNPVIANEEGLHPVDVRIVHRESAA